MKTSVSHEKSCGGIIFFGEDSQPKFLIIRNRISSGGHWDFPKGRVEAGESEMLTAKREVFEETGLDPEWVCGFRQEVSYYNNVSGKIKTVVFFLFKANSKKVKIDRHEIIDYVWLSSEEAVKKLTFENARNLLRRAVKFMCANSTYPRRSQNSHPKGSQS